MNATSPQAGTKDPAVFDYLTKRRSLHLKHMTAPGPNKDEIKDILSVAARTPDHGGIAPWYFIVFEGDNRKKAGDLLAQAYKAENPDAAPAKLELEAQRFMGAPMVIAVVSRIKEGKYPVWEQILSAGAACQNLTIAANAKGYATNWKTGWYSFSKSFKAFLGLEDGRDNIAGFIFMGTASEQPEERERPALDDIVTFWAPNEPLNKGDQYGHVGKGLPDMGFEYKG